MSRTSTRDRELAALFAATDRCRYCPEVPFRHLVMPVLFRTIYACGLRCSEARLLRVGDVDIDAGVLQIRDAKGGKDRQLPVSEPLRERLAGYHAKLAGQSGLGVVLSRRHARRAVDASERQPQLPAVSVAGADPARRPRARPPGSRSAPHDGGATTSRFWFERRRERQRAAAGAANVSGALLDRDTAYYLHLTAESYPDITARVQQAFGDIVPPVTGGVDHGD